MAVTKPLSHAPDFLPTHLSKKDLGATTDAIVKWQTASSRRWTHIRFTNFGQRTINVFSRAIDWLLSCLPGVGDHSNATVNTYQAIRHLTVSALTGNAPSNEDLQKIVDNGRTPVISDVAKRILSIQSQDDEAKKQAEWKALFAQITAFHTENEKALRPSFWDRRGQIDLSGTPKHDSPFFGQSHLDAIDKLTAREEIPLLEGEIATVIALYRSAILTAVTDPAYETVKGHLATLSQRPTMKAASSRAEWKKLETLLGKQGTFLAEVHASHAREAAVNEKWDEVATHAKEATKRLPPNTPMKKPNLPQLAAVAALRRGEEIDAKIDLKLLIPFAKDKTVCIRLLDLLIPKKDHESIHAVLQKLSSGDLPKETITSLTALYQKLPKPLPPAMRDAACRFYAISHTDETDAELKRHIETLAGGTGSAHDDLLFFLEVVATERRAETFSLLPDTLFKKVIAHFLHTGNHDSAITLVKSGKGQQIVQRWLYLNERYIEQKQWTEAKNATEHCDDPEGKVSLLRKVFIAELKDATDPDPVFQEALDKVKQLNQSHDRWTDQSFRFYFLLGNAYFDHNGAKGKDGYVSSVFQHICNHPIPGFTYSQITEDLQRDLAKWLTQAEALYRTNPSMQNDVVKKLQDAPCTETDLQFYLFFHKCAKREVTDEAATLALLKFQFIYLKKLLAHHKTTDVHQLIAEYVHQTLYCKPGISQERWDLVPTELFATLFANITANAVKEEILNQWHRRFPKDGKGSLDLSQIDITAELDPFVTCAASTVSSGVFRKTTYPKSAWEKIYDIMMQDPQYAPSAAKFNEHLQGYCDQRNLSYPPLLTKKAR